MGSLFGKDLVSIHDLTASEIEQIFSLSADLKRKQKAGIKHEYLWAKSMVMIFEKPSTRTRVSFEIGMWQLGGLAINVDQETVGLGVRESIGDVAQTLSRFADAILIRTFEHAKVEELAKYASVPVINGLSDLHHPCQALADVFTMREKGKGKGATLAYIGDGNNVCHSLMLTAPKVGMNMTIATPRGYEPNEEIVKMAFADAKANGVVIEILNDPVVAATGADIIYTDVWASMGQEKEKQVRSKKFGAFQINSQLVKIAKPNYIFMHCLPAHRGDEVTNDVMDSPNSVVFDQAENRLHVQKAVLTLLMKEGDLNG